MSLRMSVQHNDSIPDGTDRDFTGIKAANMLPVWTMNNWTGEKKDFKVKFKTFESDKIKSLVKKITH